MTEKIQKAKQNIGILKHLSRFLPLKTLDHMYKGLVRAHLDYCDVIYHIPSTKTQNGGVLSVLMNMIETVQYQAALAITGAWQGSSRTKIYEELGWESLSDRRWCRRIIQFHKIVNNMTPIYLKNKLPRIRRPLYQQTNTTTFYETRCNSDRYMNSFFPNAIKTWNNIIEIFPICNLLIFSKSVFYPSFVQKENPFSIYMILLFFDFLFARRFEPLKKS